MSKIPPLPLPSGLLASFRYTPPPPPAPAADQPADQPADRAPDGPDEAIQEPACREDEHGLLDGIPGRPAAAEPEALEAADEQDEPAAPEDAIPVEAVRVTPAPPAGQTAHQPAKRPAGKGAGKGAGKPLDAWALRPGTGLEARLADDLPAVPDPSSLLAVSEDARPAPHFDKNGKRKFSANEVTEQVSRAQELLSAGYRPNVIRSVLQKEYGLHGSTAEFRLRAARQQMVSDLNIYDRKEKVAQMVQQLEEVVRRSLHSGREANVIGALRLQADLLQLYTNRN